MSGATVKTNGHLGKNGAVGYLARGIRLWVLIVLGVMGSPGVAGAHDSLESSVSLWMRTTGMDVQIYISRASASDLISPRETPAIIVRENFATFQQRLAGVGPSLLTLSGDGGAAIKSDAISVSYTDEDDVCFTLHYPTPAVLPERLRIRVNYLQQMNDGHQASIFVLNGENDQIGRGDTTLDDPEYAVHLRAAGDLAKVGVAMVAVAVPADRRWVVWAVAGGAVLLVGILVVATLRRRPAGAGREAD